MKKKKSRLFDRTGHMRDILLKLPEDRVNLVANKILENAYSLIKDAQLLIEKNKSYGHAFGLLALACEEIAKANMIFLRIDRKSKKDPFLNHIEKQEMLAALTFTRYVTLYIIRKYFKNINEKNLREEHLQKIFKKTLKEFIDELDRNPELKNRFLQRQYFFGRIEIIDGEEIYETGVLSEIREYSLYVDLVSDNELLTPKNIPEDNTLALMKIAEEDLYYTDLLYNGGKLIKKYNLQKPELPSKDE